MLQKSNVIVFQQGKLIQQSLTLNSGEIIQSINHDDHIKYLGCTFNNELVLNSDAIKPLMRIWRN